MRKISVLLFPLLAIALLMAVASGTAAAQSAAAVGDNSIYFVTYFANNVSAAPDATVRLVNDGDTAGDLWAAFYVFDDSEELTECCACEITPDGLLAEDVKTQLTANPLTGKVPTRGVIKTISSSSLDPTAVIPTAGLRGWATHIQLATKTTYGITETALTDSNLTATEETLLQNLCFYDSLLSGLPCTCTPEDHDF
ncbi:MAG: hypothetical protein ABSD39_04200 [Terriglobales bacterium]|jgi:hypothetical protein